MITKHDIVIEVDEVGSQTRDTMEVGLYSRGTIRGEVGVVWEDVLQTPHLIHTHRREDAL